MNKSIVNIKYEQVYYIMFELIKWPTMLTAINNSVLLRFCVILFFEFKLTLGLYIFINCLTRYWSGFRWKDILRGEFHFVFTIFENSKIAAPMD